VTRHALVTGGAGFIGTALVDRLIERGDRVTILDDLSGATPERRAELAAAAGERPGIVRFVQGSVVDLGAVEATLTGVDVVYHLAANTDIAGGFTDPRLDLEGCILGTWNVCEAMRRAGVAHVAYASSGVVYGDPDQRPTPESAGPLRPASHYAAGKLAGEAIVSGFAHLYRWQAQAFRFGNTIGGGSDHGVVHDLVVKLLRNPGRLEILGDGRQAKPYIAVEDVVDAVLHAMDRQATTPFDVFNVATTGTLTVLEVADVVIRALGLDPAGVEVRPTVAPGAASRGGWPGDTPIVDFDTSRIRALGWLPKHDARAAVHRAALATRERLEAVDVPLLTASERRAAQRALVGAGR
jgi:UDP-glucose 4-epimerase